MLMSRRTRALTVLFLMPFLMSSCSLPGGGGGTYKLIAYFPRAVSVYPSSQVRVLGLPAGKVDKVEVVGTEVKITMSIDKDVPVPKDVHALLAPQSLIGERYVALSPAWHTGLDKAPDGMELRNTPDEPDRTIIPVEPDEALAELKKFFDSLDPNGLGRLINNTSDDLQGQGATLNHALDEVSQLVSTFAAKDSQLADIVDNFDKFTATLATRETQLGDILSTFSQATQVLADERQSIENLLAGLADLSRNGLQLVSKHAAQLRTDLDTLTRLAQSIDVNLDGLGKLLDSGPILVDGIINAYNAPIRAINLRQNFGPVVAEAFDNLFGPGFPVPRPCIPGLQTCPLAVNSASAGAAVTINLPQATTPVDDLLDLMRSPTVSAPPPPSTGDRVASGASGLGGFLRRAAGAVVGGS
jgi:phospholipid/cholesterol/gamma-HCH transport system substrate-binding protein